MRPTDVEITDIWRATTLVGTSTRAAHGSVFEYLTKIVVPARARRSE